MADSTRNAKSGLISSIWGAVGRELDAFLATATGSLNDPSVRSNAFWVSRVSVYHLCSPVVSDLGQSNRFLTKNAFTACPWQTIIPQGDIVAKTLNARIVQP